MATPSYKGQGQPTASGGGWFGSIFSASAPAYTGVGQPTARASAYSSGSAPAYQPVPTPTVAAATTDDDCSAPAQFAIVIPRQVIDSKE